MFISLGMARRTRKDKQTFNDLRDEPLEQPQLRYESHHQSSADQLMIDASQEQVQPSSSLKF